MRSCVFLRWIAVACAFVVAVTVGGCSSGGTAPGTGTNSGAGTGQSSGGTVAEISLTGLVHATQPVVGATVNLYAAGTSGYGSGAVSLLNGSAAVTTDGTGKFSMTNDFTCPSTDTQVYIVAKGGNAGAGDNNSLVFMSALGSCGGVESGTVADVSPISSVASVYALAQFLTPNSTSVGTSSTNVSGLVNAFAMVPNLIDSSSGAARAMTPAGNGTVPRTTINTLANIVAACANTAGQGVCQQFFSLATPPGGTTPTDTLSALLNIALNPGKNVAQLYALQASGASFQPALTGAPSDWTLSIEYTGGGLNRPQLPAVDGSGNVWVPNAVDPGTLSEFSPTGKPLSGTGGFGGGGLSYPQAVAVDMGGNIWSANEGVSSVSKHTSGGVPLSGTGYTAAGLVHPVAIALDAAGDVFTANDDSQNDTVTELNAGGSLVRQYVNGGLDSPYAVAIDTSQNIWVANNGASNSVSEFSNAGAPLSITGYTGGGMSGPFGLAIDATGDVWVANFNHSSVSELSSTGKVLSGAGFAAPAPVSAVAVDGSNTIWTANTDGSVSRFAASGASISPATGYISAGATAEVGIALDASGNVWTTDNYVDSIFEYIGAASPTVTPLQLALKNKVIGRRP